MHEPDETTWIYAGNCPVCQCGLRRIRVCETPDGDLRGYVMCDECEAIWLTPDELSSYRFPRDEKPECPVSDLPLYGPQSRWATVSDVEHLGWLDQVTVDSGIEPSVQADIAAAVVAPEDMAGDLDAPAALRLNSAIVLPVDPSADAPKHSQPQSSDPSYGADEPRPGC